MAIVEQLDDIPENGSAYRRTSTKYGIVLAAPSPPPPIYKIRPPAGGLPFPWVYLKAILSCSVEGGGFGSPTLQFHWSDGPHVWTFPGGNPDAGVYPVFVDTTFEADFSDDPISGVETFYFEIAKIPGYGFKCWCKAIFLEAENDQGTHKNWTITPDDPGWIFYGGADAEGEEIVMPAVEAQPANGAYQDDYHT